MLRMIGLENLTLKIESLNRETMDIDNTPVWRILNIDGKIKPVLSAWYTCHKEEDFLTTRTFGTKKEVDEWLKEFWQTYWRL